MNPTSKPRGTSEVPSWLLELSPSPGCPLPLFNRSVMKGKVNRTFTFHLSSPEPDARSPRSLCNLVFFSPCVLLWLCTHVSRGVVSVMQLRSSNLKPISKTAVARGAPSTHPPPSGATIITKPPRPQIHQLRSLQSQLQSLRRGELCQYSGRRCSAPLRCQWSLWMADSSK